MKVYMFYIYGDKIYDKEYIAVSENTMVTTNNVIYALYAFTNKKEYAKKFKEYRDMSIFFEKIIHLDNDEYDNLKEKYTECELKYILYNFPRIYHNNSSNYDMTYILSTNLEYDKIRFESNYYISKIFDNIKNVLTYIEPDDFIPEISYIMKNVFEYNGMVSWLEMIDDIPFDICSINEVTLYMYLYDNTYKKGGMIKCIYGDSLKNQIPLKKTYL